MIIRKRYQVFVRNIDESSEFYMQHRLINNFKLVYDAPWCSSRVRFVGEINGCYMQIIL